MQGHECNPIFQKEGAIAWYVSGISRTYASGNISIKQWLNWPLEKENLGMLEDNLLRYHSFRHKIHVKWRGM